MDLGAARSVWYDREANISPSTLLNSRAFLSGKSFRVYAVVRVSGISVT